MDDIIKESLTVNLQVLKFLRLYDHKKSSTSELLRTYVIYFSIMVHLPVFCSLYFILEDDIDSSRVGEDALALAGLTCYFAKLLPFLVNRERIRNCIRFLSQVRMRINQKQQQILQESIKVCKRNSYMFLISIISGLIFWTMKPIFLFTHRLPVDVWIPFDLTHHRVVFCCVYFYVSLGVCYPSAASAAIDPLIGGLACLASGHLRILKDNLQFLGEYVNEEIAENVANMSIRSEIMHRKLHECIDLHNTILSFVQEFEQCFTQVVFCQFVGSVFNICFCCFQLSMLKSFNMESLSMLNYLFIVMVQVYFYCYYGTELFEESNDLTKAIYMGKWYEYDMKTKKVLLTIMERSKRPIVITAGKVFDLSLETFTTILRRSYSLLAVLNNQQ